MWRSMRDKRDLTVFKSSSGAKSECNASVAEKRAWTSGVSIVDVDVTSKGPRNEELVASLESRDESSSRLDFYKRIEL